jgi:dihydroflavonol-4-reductase
VDVRDVAQAHLAAAFVPDANGRHIVSGHETNLLELGRVLLDRYGSEYPIPRRALPKWLAWLVGPLVAKGTTRRFVARNVDIPWRADNSRSRRELGVTYRPMRESMEQMFRQMIDAGYFQRR